MSDVEASYEVLAQFSSRNWI